MTADQTLTITAPTFGGESRRDVPQMLADAAWKLRNGYTPGGSTVTEGVAKLLDDVASTLDVNVKTTYGGHVPNPRVPTETVHVTDLTGDERKALPAAYHQPVFYDLFDQGAWVCAVCWDEGEMTEWPCGPACRNGGAVAHAGGLEHIR